MTRATAIDVQYTNSTRDVMPGQSALRNTASDIEGLDSPHLLPGAAKYGDVDALLALAKAASVTVFGGAKDAALVEAASALRGNKTRIESPARREIDQMVREAAEAITKE